MEGRQVPEVMAERNPILVVLFCLVSFNIYYIVWLVKTKGELVRSGGRVPTAWLLIVPVVNWYWLYRYYQAAGQVTGRVKASLLFLIQFGLAVLSGTAYYLNFQNANSDQPSSDIGTIFLVLNIALALVHFGVIIYLQSSYNKLQPRPQD